MSMEAIKNIREAEDEARQAKLNAQQNARDKIEAANKAGKESIDSALSRAESEIAHIKRSVDQKAMEQAVELESTTANRQAALRARVESRMDTAVQLIIERIVNV